MTNRYAPLPDRDGDDSAGREMEAAFDDSDDEDNAQETTRLTTSSPNPQRQPAAPAPGSYDFENVDYDHPPPGSPPPVPGNSNGLVPSFDSVITPSSRTGWFRRLLPARFSSRDVPQGPVGGGGSNDGVFANVTAKPAAPMHIQDGDSSYVVPEDTRAEAPPSYAAAQADSVPPYWETTVHAPFSPDAAGEMIVDALQTGTVFSFLWNMLISVSFQFVGFLLTYLLHTSHAARLGSRAGLGITLIQYGFALRQRLDSSENSDPWKTNWSEPSPRPTFPTAAEGGGNSTIPSPTSNMLDEEQASILIADATTEWLSFFLMTIGWFVLLTSVLGFFRIKRWERSIMQSQPENSSNSSPDPEDRAILSRLEQAFRLHGASNPGDFFRTGLGLGTRDADEAAADRAVRQAEEGEVDSDDERELNEEAMLLQEGTPEEQEALHQALVNERRLHDDLRAAGLL